MAIRLLPSASVAASGRGAPMEAGCMSSSGGILLTTHPLLVPLFPLGYRIESVFADSTSRTAFADST